MILTHVVHSFLYISDPELSAGAVILGKRTHKLEGESSISTKLKSDGNFAIISIDNNPYCRKFMVHKFDYNQSGNTVLNNVVSVIIDILYNLQLENITQCMSH